MLPELAASDSAVIMYYHSPGEPRFFNMVKLRSPNPLSSVAADVNQLVITAKDTCTTQGKIYFYGKAGAVETVYFSRNKDCMTLSFIKTGEKYFTSMGNETLKLLDSLEKNVIVLPGEKE
ncbi:MAG: hypothetical protein ABIR30_08050 [Chitinophagaceae bacterium]